MRSTIRDMKVVLSESRNELRARTSAAPEERESPAVEGLQSAIGVLLAVSLAGLAWSAFQPAAVLWIGLRIDRITSIVAVLASGVGLATLRYASRCLEGHPRRVWLLRWMAFTTLAAWFLAISDGFLPMIGAWIAVGIGLQRMLGFRRECLGVADSAARVLALSIVGDILLAAACAAAWWSWGATSLSESVESVAAGPAGPAAMAFAILACCAAIVKTAQVPLHGWLPDTMDAPTPVSALMHAGVINAGGVLLIRLAPAIERVPEAWLLLSLVGTASILVAVPTAWFQLRAKSALAWSTIAQMGFMLVQCGLCAFPSALLHILGHGTYKAWAFLRAGEVPGRGAPAPHPIRALVLLVLGTATAIPSTALALRTLGLSNAMHPAKLALLSVLCIAVGQVWIALLGARRSSLRATTTRLLAACGTSAILPGIACALYGAASWWTGQPLVSAPQSPGIIGWTAAALPVLAIAALAVMHALLPLVERRPLGLSLRVHAASGFYLWILVARFIDRLRPAGGNAMEGVARA